jgi:hypothetical protein
MHPAGVQRISGETEHQQVHQYHANNDSKYELGIVWQHCVSFVKLAKPDQPSGFGVWSIGALSCNSNVNWKWACQGFCVHEVFGM